MTISLRCRARGHRQSIWRWSAVASLSLGACADAQQPPDGTLPGAAHVSTTASSPCSDSLAAFRRVVSEFQQRQQNTAIVVGVRHLGVTVFREASGFANSEDSIHATPEMAFGIASMTKGFTGATLLKLVESGRIDLDADIQRYVPEFPRHASGRAVTIRMLAHHLGALRHWGTERNEQLYARHFDDIQEILALFREDAWEPGLEPLSRYSYSSYGYNALGMAIQSASGMPFQQYLSEAVLRPLRLTSVQVDRPGLGGVHRPARYSWYDLVEFHDLTDAPQRVPDWDYSHNMAGGGLIANVDDLLTFGRAMREPGLLSNASLEQLWRRPTIEGVESRMSFGWFPKTDPTRLSSSGSNAGAQAALTVWRDEDVVVAVLANSWGRGSRSGEFMDDSAEGLVGRLAALCGAR